MLAHLPVLALSPDVEECSDCYIGNVFKGRVFELFVAAKVGPLS